MKTPSAMNENTLAALEEQVHTLNEQAWNLRKSDVQQARKLAEQSLVIGRSLLNTNSDSPVYKQEIATALLVLASCDVRLSGWAPALDKAYEALKYFEEIGDDPNRIHCLETMVRAYSMRGDSASALEMAYRSLDLAEKEGDLEAKGRAMNMLGVLYWHTADYNRALGWYQQSLDILRECGNRQEMSEVLNNLGLVYTSLGDENKAFEYCLSGLLTKKELDDRLGESYALLNIGNLYMNKNELGKALAHYLECLYIQEEIGDRDGRAHSLINLSRVHLEMGDYDKALEYAGMCLEISRDVDNRRIQSYALFTFGTLYEKQGLIDMALEAHKQSLMIRQEISYRQGEIASLLALGALHTQLGSFSDAVSCLLEALAIAGDLDAKGRMAEVHEKLAEMYETDGNMQQALRHYKRVTMLQKEVFNEQSSAQLKNLQLLYEMEQATKEAEIYRLENIELAAANREISQQKHRLEAQAKNIEAYNRELQRKNTVLENMSRERDEFFGITVHGLNTPISLMLLFVSSLKANRKSMTDSEIEKSLETIEATLWRMESTVRKLLRSNDVESRPLLPHPDMIDLAQIIAEVAEDYKVQADIKNINMVLDIPYSEAIAFADPALLWEVVDNLISNAVKFSPPNTAVRISTLASVPDEDETEGYPKTVRLVVSDEGPGISDDDKLRLFGRFARLSAQPTGGENSTGLGLSIVKRLVESMQGEIWYDSSGPGATFIVELPAEELEIF